MGSVSRTGAAAARSKLAAQDETEVSTTAERLVDQHGNEADIVAARRADAMLREGKTAEGARLLEIFRRLALRF